VTGTLWITGAAGWSGRHLLACLKSLDERPRLVGVDIVDDPPEGLDAYRCLDICRPDQVKDLCSVEPPTWVIHLAGAMPPAPDEQLWRVNVGGTAGLLMGLWRAAGTAVPPIRVVSIGSAAEYMPSASEAIKESNPCGGLAAYGHSKWAQCLLALAMGRELGIEVVVARSFNLIGPGLSSRLVAGALCEQFAGAKDGAEILVGNTRSVRDFVDIRDAVKAYWLLVRNGENGEIYNVCSGISATIESLLSLFVRACGHQVSWRVDPQRLKGQDAASVVGRGEKLRLATGWVPRIPLERSVEDMLVAAGRLRL
jgi:GDP-4-dehydro-6-deoxy-D-mannose reductase